MSKKRIIFIPGKNPKPPTAYYQKLLWRTLIEGVHRVNPLTAKLLSQSTEFSVLDWNKEYYGTQRPIAKEIPWVNRLIRKTTVTKTDLDQVYSWKRKLGLFFISLFDWFAFVLDYLPSSIHKMVEETNYYFEDRDKIATRIRTMLKDQLRPLLDDDYEVLLIGHSFGSIIAYDALWELSQEKISNKLGFLTLGSPLGFNYVQSKLQGSQFKDERRFPNCIKHWCNIASEGDIVALRNLLYKGPFGRMKSLGLLNEYQEFSKGIYNIYRDDEGFNCHQGYGYFMNSCTAQAISDWFHNSYEDDMKWLSDELFYAL